MRSITTATDLNTDGFHWAARAIIAESHPVSDIQRLPEARDQDDRQNGLTCCFLKSLDIFVVANVRRPTTVVRNQFISALHTSTVQARQ